MLETILGISLMILIPALVIGAIMWGRAIEKKRQDDLRECAESMGLVFSIEDVFGLSVKFGHFKLFSRGSSRKIENVIQGDSGDVAITIFDYRFVTGSGKNRSTHSQSIVALTSPHLNCPDFTIRPEVFLDRVGGAMGFQDIDFDSHEKFSSMFVLKGSSEEAIRAYLKPELLELFETKPGISLEAVRDTMFFYKPRVKIKPDQVKDSLAEAYEFYGVMSEE